MGSDKKLSQLMDCPFTPCIKLYSVQMWSLHVRNVYFAVHKRLKIYKQSDNCVR